MEQDWMQLISNFRGLVSELVRHVGKYQVHESLSRDKKTVSRWLEGVQPASGADVAWVVRLALQRAIDISPFQTFLPIYDFSPMLTYEQKVKDGPPDLSWLTSIQAPPRVSHGKFCGLMADCPLGVASSPLVSDHRWTSLVLDLGFG